MVLLLLLSHFSHVWLCDPIDSSPPGSPIPRILQARTLEWVAISFSNAWKWKVKVKSLSCVQLLETPWTAAHQAPPSMGFSRQKYWSGVPLPKCLIKGDFFFSCRSGGLKFTYMYYREFSLSPRVVHVQPIAGSPAVVVKNYHFLGRCRISQVWSRNLHF